jgi:ribokinase
MSEDTSKRRGICVVGSANVDLTFRTPRLPVPGETLAGRSLHQCMGGKGANQAVVAARLGADVTFVARVGNDGFGAEAIEAYQAEGINTSFIQQDDEQPTGTAAILVDDNAENCIIVVAGANACLTPEHAQAARLVIENSNVLLSQLETPAATTLKAFQMARATNVLTILTPAPAENVTPELLELCDICVPNKTEIATIVGQPVNSEQDVIHAAAFLRSRGVKRVVLTMGGDGVLLVDESGSSHIPATKVEAVDTTGAGDAFTGALAVGLAEGLTLEEAARRSGVVAAIAVTRTGTQPSFPTLKELNQWIAT